MSNGNPALVSSVDRQREPFLPADSAPGAAALRPVQSAASRITSLGGRKLKLSWSSDEAEKGDAGAAFEPSIQGLRGLAALSILLFQLYDIPLRSGFLPSLPAWLGASIHMGGHGAELFFMISGYLIPASLARHQLVSTFFYDRCLRILPLFVVLHFLLFTIGPVVGYKFFGNSAALASAAIFLSNLGLLPDLSGTPTAQGNAWSLAYLCGFYIWFATIYYCLVSPRRWLAALPFVALGIVAVVFFPIASYFAVGILFRATRFRSPIQGWQGIAAGALCVAVMYLCLERSNPFVGLVPAILLFAMVAEPVSSLAKALSAAGLQYLGKISYSLVLIQPFALFPLHIAAIRLAERGDSLWALWIGFVVLGLIASLVAAEASYHLIERRLSRGVDAFCRRSFLRPIEERASHA
jgi:peptidoglycan/LPS O-acetylase OafA/YrhL